MKTLSVLALACIFLNSCSKADILNPSKPGESVFFRVQSVSEQGVPTYSKIISIKK